MTRIVTTHYRYKRPPRKRGAVPLEGPAIVTKRAPPSQQARGVQKQHHAEPEQGASKPAAPANDDRKPVIVTARRPGAKLSVEVPDMTPEEHRRRGDAAAALFREIVRQAAGKLLTELPQRHLRSYGIDPLPTPAEALAEPFAAFPSWF